MLPPGLSFNAVSAKARAAAKQAKLPRVYWRWEDMIRANQSGYFPYTPATNLLYGLREALNMLLKEEGLDQVFARHARLAEATRRAVRAWAGDLSHEVSTATRSRVPPEGHDADKLRATY
jgi:alanine-glyoxylate transaminase/serine-glyoxylate transaminase/serine-pyruvate transaminase